MYSYSSGSRGPLERHRKQDKCVCRRQPACSENDWPRKATSLQQNEQIADSSCDGLLPFLNQICPVTGNGECNTTATLECCFFASMQEL